MEHSFESTPQLDDCPSASKWAAFAVGRVEQLDQQLMSLHLQRCFRCSDILDRISSSASRPHRDNPISPYLSEENYLRLEERLARIETKSGYPNDNEFTQESETPKTLGRFEIKGILGSGGFGQVYLGHDPLLKRSVAIKAPKRMAFGTEGNLTSFLTEARHAAALDHPNIVPIYDVVGDESGHALIVMKYVCGNPLSLRLLQGPISLDVVLQLMIVVAKAVHYAHERGFAHRDLKPSNILIDDRGQPHVTDFGLGLNLLDENSQSVSRGGTPAYMSPEQIRHDVLVIDQRSDIWALGVVLSELVHGRRPFPQKNREKLFYEIQFGEPLIESAKETIGVDRIIRKCLRKDPTDRIPTAEGLARQLQDLHNRSFSRGAKKWIYGGRRNLLVLLFFMVIIMSTWAYFTSEHQRSVRSSFDQIKNASLNNLPHLLERLRKLKPTLENLDSEDETLSTSTARLNASLTSLILGDNRADVINFVVDFLETASAEEIECVGQIVNDEQVNVQFERTVARRLEETLDADSILRLSASLALLNPQNPIWPSIESRVASTLVSMPRVQLERWLPCYEKVASRHLADPLREYSIDPSVSTEVRLSATVALVKLCAKDTNFLCNLLCDAEDFQVPFLAEALRADHKNAIACLKQLYRSARKTETLLESPSTADLPISNAVRDSNLAVASWILGDREIAYELFQAIHDMTPMTLSVHNLAQIGVDVETIVEELQKLTERNDQYSASIKFGLLQIASLVHTSHTQHSELRELLNYLWLNDKDIGVHSMARLTALRNGIKLPDLPRLQRETWLVDSIGGMYQDFAIIEPCVTELGIPDDQVPPLLTDPWPRHFRKFSKRFAIATNEVTIEQFRVFDREYFATDTMLLASEPNAAMALISFEAAYRFCNCWSEASGLQSCYEQRTNENGQLKLYPKLNHLSLDGYRLPTDGEWELACRALSTTNRFYGNVSHVESKYGWVSETPGIVLDNGGFITQPVAFFLPNRWGIFDFYGNVKEICDFSYPPGQYREIAIDDHASTAMEQPESRRIRGLSLDASGELWAHSYCRTDRIVGESERLNGLRVVRTLTSR